MFRSTQYLVCAVIIFIGAQVSAITLRDAYEHARDQRASLRERVLDEGIANDQQNFALSQLLPQVSINSIHTLRDEVGGNSTTSAFGQGYQHNAQITVDQPIFQGGALFHSLKIASTGKRIAELQRKQAELELFREVARSFYSWLTLQTEIANLKEQGELLQKRIDFLERWVKIGRAKESELVAALSQQARNTADLSKQQSELQVVQRQLEWITGLREIKELNDTLAMDRLLVPASWRSDVEGSPSLRASELTWENSKRQISSARANYWPTASLQGNYYLKRAGILASSKWDATLTLRWEFFSSGETVAEAAMAAKEAQKSEIRFADLKRQLKQEFEGQHSRIEYQKHTVAKLESAEKLAWKSYTQLQKEYQNGLINNLEVLRALDDHLTVKRALDREKFATKLAWIELSILAGHQP